MTHGERRPRTGWTLILGPPGTGKTTTLLRLIDHELMSMEPWQIAFVTFTRAARIEALERSARKFKLSQDDLRWFRTIHSTAYRLLGIRRDQMLTSADVREFAKQYGYDFSPQRSFREDEQTEEPTPQKADDELMAMLSWGRSRMYDVPQTLRHAPYNVVPDVYEAFVRRYQAFRTERERYDFHDLLELALAADTRPPVTTAFIDESQDLSPAQIALVEKWFMPCDRVFVAGDDDQAIYEFMGAQPDWILSLRDRCERVEILEQSYRVPQQVHTMAQGMIAQNKKRVSKRYWPTPETGELRRYNNLPEALIDHENTDTFVLARNWWVLERAAAELRERGLAFWAERHPHWTPLGRPKLVGALRAALALSRGEEASPRQLEALLCDFIPAATKQLPHGLPRGTKKRARDNKHPLGPRELRSAPWGLYRLVDAIGIHGPVAVMTKLESKTRRALEALLARYDGKIPTPRISLLSIHASKGREAQTVVILPDMARKSYDAYLEGEESEHRLAYVAATRSKHNLVIIDPQTHKAYDYSTHMTRALRTRPRQPGEDDPDQVGW